MRVVVLGTQKNGPTMLRSAAEAANKDVDHDRARKTRTISTFLSVVAVLVVTLFIRVIGDMSTVTKDLVPINLLDQLSLVQETVLKLEMNPSEWSRRSTPQSIAASLQQTADSETVDWVQFPVVDDVDETQQFMLQIRKNGTLPCHDVKTQSAQILGLQPENSQLNPMLLLEGEQQESTSVIRLEAGHVYEVLIVSIGDDGQPRCAGGDYYETDLSGPRWKSRPPVLDNNNGTYSMRLQVDPRFAGEYTFKVVLLFSNFHGLDYSNLDPLPFTRWGEFTSRYEIEFVVPEPKLLMTRNGNGAVESSEANSRSGLDDVGIYLGVPQIELPKCRRQDFQKKYWSGRWTREKVNEDCEIDKRGRWQCVDGDLQCQQPWCEGPVGSLESNGWVYSAHCAFKIFQVEEAWKCLDGKWLFFWGDSNHMDTIRNLLNFVLGFNHAIEHVTRRIDSTYFSPPHNQSSVRITSMFNGHSNAKMNQQGLFSLHDGPFAEQLRSFFTGETAPDFMIMNSGLHDGLFWKDVESFLKDGVEFAAEFWADVWNKMTARRPDIVYRTTVATAGHARNMSFNPHKMEVFNHLMVDKFVNMKLDNFHIVDGFDYTFPWHWDHKFSDGVHYGRLPGSITKWAPSANVSHRYFVDLMLVHMLLNAMCTPNS